MMRIMHTVRIFSNNGFMYANAHKGKGMCKFISKVSFYIIVCSFMSFMQRFLSMFTLSYVRNNLSDSPLLFFIYPLYLIKLCTMHEPRLGEVRSIMYEMTTFFAMLQWYGIKTSNKPQRIYFRFSIILLRTSWPFTNVKSLWSLHME